MPAERPQWRIEMQLDGPSGDWTDVSRDVLDGDSVRAERGIQGSGPNDRVADTGKLSFALNNSVDNSVALAGYYSPDHFSARLGFDLGVGVRLRIAHMGHWRNAWQGTIDEIIPMPDHLGERKTLVSCVDWMEEAAAHRLTGLATVTDVRADDVMTAIVDAVPKAPAAVQFDEGSDVYPFANDATRDTTAMTEFSRIARSELGQVFVKADGTLRFENRYARLAVADPLATLGGTMMGMRLSRARRDVVNKIRVIVHPRRVDSGFVVLGRLEDRPLIAPGESITIRINYQDPENPAERIGALDVQIPLTPGVDYLMDTVQATAVGTPDTPTIIRPMANGHYTGFSGSATDAGDQNDATGLTPTGGFAYATFALTDVAAPNNAAVSGVKVRAHVRHNDPDPVRFTAWFPRLRLNDVDLDGPPSGTYAAGIEWFETEFPTPPGAGEWTIGSIKTLEAGGAFNWSGATPELLELEVLFIYASNVLPTDRTDNFTVLAVDGGSSAEVTLTNNGSDGAYVNLLQIRGRGVYTFDDVTAEVSDAASIAEFGERVETLDMPYQADVNTGIRAASYIMDLFKIAKSRITGVTFLANSSDELMNAALDREISDRVLVSEIQTGLSLTGAEHHINAVSLNIQAGNILYCTWTLVPADPNDYWQVGIAGHSEVGETTIVGPL